MNVARRLLRVALATVLGVTATMPCVAPASAADAAAGYVGKGQLVVQTSLGGAGNDITVGGDIALEEKGSFLRLDLLSLAIPGAGAAISSLLSTQLFPPGGFTVVYDRAASTYTIWSNSKRNYYTSAPASGATASAAGTIPAGAALGAANDLFGAFAFARSLRNDTTFNVSLTLAGHGTVNGHPATGLDYQYARTTSGGDSTSLHGRLQLADDLDGVPVQITASGQGKSLPQSSMRLDLTTLATQTPPDGDFHVPAGYARANDLGDVIGKSLPH